MYSSCLLSKKTESPLEEKEYRPERYGLKYVSETHIFYFYTW